MLTGVLIGAVASFLVGAPACFAFAMIGYPILGYFIGHQYPQSPPFGLTPCPLSVFTFGLLLLADSKVPKWILAIPFLYAIGGIMPVSIGVTEDLAMIIGGLVGTAMILYRDAHRSES